ncbi:hypothetical protein B0H66DRAFT_5147 [Apodospora peruviana]|uniref:Uncharacterized protein n=1 Tax=Apodospora peruviana TaxID=516989 RepID=A0AAE0IQW7_9PEZI|nr:hypothetical protein B0H66DRAFT_5147 [Apodospora peruviana]
MANKTGNTSKHDGWVIVDRKVSTKGHTRSRSPQYNGDNESSRHKANASSKYVNYSPVRHTARSNGSSTETGNSGATFTNQLQTVNSTYYYPSTISLTESALDRYQRELEHRAVVNVPGWITQAGTGNLFTKHMEPTDQGDMPVDGFMPSTTDRVNHGRCVPQDSFGISDVVATGSWCDTSIQQLVQAEPYLSFDAE